MPCISQEHLYSRAIFFRATRCSWAPYSQWRGTKIHFRGKLTLPRSFFLSAHVASKICGCRHGGELLPVFWSGNVSTYDHLLHQYRVNLSYFLTLYLLAEDIWIVGTSFITRLRHQGLGRLGFLCSNLCSFQIGWIPAHQTMIHSQALWPDYLIH